MEKNRKILISILILMLFSSVLAIINIGLTVNKTEEKHISVKLPSMGKGVGIVRLEGPIQFGVKTNPFGLLGGAEAIIKRLNELSSDSRIKAIVLRINSPGGSVAATQEIFQKILKVRKDNIVIIASMGDVAASGGYYAAAACNHITANHGTITGSIGVIAYSPNLKQLFDKFGITMNVIKSGKYKDILSSHRDMTPAERQLIQDMIDSSYKKFIADVALGRNMAQSAIEPYADGRVMNGETALKAGLIDSVGTFEDAISTAKKMAELPDDAPVYDAEQEPIQKFLMTLDNLYQAFSLPSLFFGRSDSYNMEYR